MFCGTCIRADAIKAVVMCRHVVVIIGHMDLTFIKNGDHFSFWAYSIESVIIIT